MFASRLNDAGQAVALVEGHGVCRQGPEEGAAAARAGTGDGIQVLTERRLIRGQSTTP